MPPIDHFQSTATSLDSPLCYAEAVTPDDTSDLNHVSRALYVGTPGDVTVRLAGGATVTFPDLGNGWHPIRVIRVLATGTSAAGLVAGW